MKAWQGQGGYGAVYRAERAGWRRSGPVALKVSLWGWNWRMEREVELLSRLSHPSIPRLVDRGGKQSPSSEEYPYFVMEWVEGVALYEWAEQQAPSSQEVCRVLGQLARALEAVHAARAVHRDVKGANVLVRLLDRRAMLIDFSSCHFAGAERLTWQSLPPVTPEYLSPQALRFLFQSEHEPESYYAPEPADDLYALGVMAYRVVMGRYPERVEARQEQQGGWPVGSADLRPLLESHSRVEPVLRKVMVRLLSEAPEARGTARQVAEELEAAAGETEEKVVSAGRPRARVHARAWKLGSGLAAAGACAALLWNWQRPPVLMAASTQQTADAQRPAADTAAVGDTSHTEPRASTPALTEEQPLAQESLPELRPAQVRSDKKGRCPGRKQVPINGGCWLELPPLSAEECASNSFVPFQGKCYAPAIEPPRKPASTSSPAEAR